MLINAVGKRKPGFKLALTACGVAVVVVILGAFTRLVDAGLGCPDWPGCYGHLTWPKEHHEIIAANQAFPDSPVETDKTWPEMVHRYFASALGLFCIALVYTAFRQRGLGQPFVLPLCLLGLVILQGLFGKWTVTLKLWPQVVTAHLLGGFATLSLLWLLTQRLNAFKWRVPMEGYIQLQKLRPLLVIALIVVACQVALGGWTSSNYAALACPDLPKCQQQWLPPMDFAEGFNVAQSIGPNYLGGQMEGQARTAIHFTHRVGAVITTAYLLFFAYVLAVKTGLSQARLGAKVLLAVLVVQLVLGMSNIIWHLPLAVAVAHNAGGALLVLVLVTLGHRIYTAVPLDTDRPAAGV